MSFRLYLDLGLYPYLPPHREPCVSAVTCRHRVSEMCAPWVCLAGGARSCVCRTVSLVNWLPAPEVGTWPRGRTPPPRASR